MSTSVRKSIRHVFALAALTSLMIVVQAVSSQAQWVTNGGHISNTNPGSIGVGTTDPTLGGKVGGKLTVVAADDNATAIATGNGTLPRFALNNHSNGSWTMFDFVGDVWNRGITQHSGNVGIGTVAPAHRLDVSGAVNASGGLCILGDCRTSWSQMSGGWTSNGTNTSLANGVVNIWSGARFAVTGGHMKPGSLTIGSIVESYGGGVDWTSNMAGLMLETTSDTEIAAHDSNTRVASLMRYEGDAANRITIGRNVGWGTISTIALNGNVGVGTSTPSSKLHVIGDITVSGNINAKYQDVAEWVPSREKLAVGTVVVVDAKGVNHVLASSSAYDTSVAGVITGQPGLLLGEEGEGKVKVATTGRVKVKVDATRFPIRAGDLLVTSSVAGVAMRSEPVSVAGINMHRPGTLIGKALESLEKGTGEILVLLSLQ